MLYYNKLCERGLSQNILLYSACTVLTLLMMMWDDTMPAWWDEVSERRKHCNVVLSYCTGYLNTVLQYPDRHLITKTAKWPTGG